MEKVGILFGRGPVLYFLKPIAGSPQTKQHIFISLQAPKSSRNFVHWNALSQMRNAPGPAPEERMVDQPNGNSQPVEKAGLAPKFTFKKVMVPYIREALKNLFFRDIS